MTQNAILSKSAEYASARKVLGDHRKVFESVTDAITALRSIYATAGFPASFPVVGARIGAIDISGDDTIPPLASWPEEYRTEGVKVAVTFIGVRGLKDDKGKESNGARGFALYPLHPLDAIQGDETGIAWLWKVAEKESSHVALRGLRGVNPALGNDALAQAAMEMPISVSDYVEESTREAMDTSTFDTMWTRFRKMLSDSPATAAIVPRLPQKAEVLKAIRSKAFATENYSELESMGTFAWMAGTMADIVDVMRSAAIESGEDFDMDSSEIRGWLATRDTKIFATPKKVETDISTVDFNAFMAGLAGPSADTGETGEAPEAGATGE
jgi:hypothetical protein